MIHTGGPEAVLARASIAALETQETADLGEPIDLFGDEEGFLVAYAQSYLRYAEDPMPMLLTTIQQLEGAAPPMRRQLTHLLTRATARTFSDPGAAGRYVWAHRAQTMDQWLADAARDADPGVRLSACAALRPRKPSMEGRAALYAALESRDGELRLTAAKSLARWGDRRAAPVLAAFLPREDAFLALGWLAPSTLGFDPDTSMADRRAAVARWRAWATRVVDPDTR
jgi:hypothetical protein